MFNINKDILNRVLTKETGKEYIKLGFIVLVTITLFNVITMYSTYKTSLEKYYTRLETVDRLNGVDLNLICNTVTCDKLESSNGVTYKSINGILRRDTVDISKFEPLFCNVFNEDYDTVIEFKGNRIIVDDSAYFDSVNTLMIINYFFLFLFFTIPFFIYKYERIKILDIRDKAKEEELEIALQRDLGESIGHEINLPLALLKSLITSMYKHLTEKPSCLAECELVDKKTYDLVKIDDMYSNSIMAVETIEEVIHTISNTKKLKYQETEASIYEIITTITNFVNSLSVRKIDVTIVKGRDIAKRFRPCRELGNSKTGRILKNHIVNSKEAKASKLSIMLKMIDTNVVEMLLVDNGIGIQDKHGNIVKDPNIIFEQGVTTKKANGEIARDGKSSKLRGIGMYINKKELESIGGSVEVLKTTKQGTIFRLVFKVVEKKKERV